MKRILSVILCVLFFTMLCSCNSVEKGPESMQSDAMISIVAICNRECNVLLLDNMRLLELSPIANSDDYNRVYGYDIKAKGPISADSLFILAGVFHRDFTDFLMDVFTDEGRSEIARMSERIPGNLAMEQQIKDYFESRYSPHQKGSQGGGIMFAPIDTDYDYSKIYPIEYRTAGCTSITITSTEPLFGREAGTDISDMFELITNSPYGSWDGYLFNYDSKTLVGKMGFDGLSIKDYLALRPTVLPVCYYHMTQSPVEAPVETDLTIDIGMDDGKHISATTHINLSVAD